MLEPEGWEHCIDNQLRPWSLTVLKNFKATFIHWQKISEKFINLSYDLEMIFIGLENFMQRKQFQDLFKMLQSYMVLHQSETEWVLQKKLATKGNSKAIEAVAVTIRNNTTNLHVALYNRQFHNRIGITTRPLWHWKFYCPMLCVHLLLVLSSLVYLETFKQRSTCFVKSEFLKHITQAFVKLTIFGMCHFCEKREFCSKFKVVFCY